MLLSCEQRAARGVEDDLAGEARRAPWEQVQRSRWRGPSMS
jgi:hypothetical protein